MNVPPIPVVTPALVIVGGSWAESQGPLKPCAFAVVAPAASATVRVTARRMRLISVFSP